MVFLYLYHFFHHKRRIVVSQFALIFTIKYPSIQLVILGSFSVQSAVKVLLRYDMTCLSVARRHSYGSYREKYIKKRDFLIVQYK